MGGRSKTHLQTLRLGAKGNRVQLLQQRLKDLGYDPGAVDGVFGYLTQDAVLALQKDFGLRADGVVGRRGLALLAEAGLQSRRQIYVLRAGENLADAAQALGVTVEALRHMNRLSVRAKGYPGQRLVCRSHYSLAALRREKKAGVGVRTLRKWAKTLSAIAVPAAILGPNGLEIDELNPAVRGVVSENGLALWLTVASLGHVMGGEGGEDAASGFLARKRHLEEATAAIGEMARGEKAGIWVDLSALRWGDGAGLLRFVRSLRQNVAKSELPLMISLPLPDSRGWWNLWLNDLDYARLAAEADRVVLACHHPTRLTDFAGLRRRIGMVLRLVPPWKAILGIGLRAEERDQTGRLLSVKSYTKGLTESYLARVRPRWDVDAKLLQAQIEEKTLWLPGKKAVAARLELLESLHLGGVALWPVGEEDERLWSLLPARIQAERD